MFLFLNLLWGIVIIIALIASPTWEIFITMSLIGLITMALTTAGIFLLNPIKINENGFIIKNQQSRTLTFNWEVINWDDI